MSDYHYGLEEEKEFELLRKKLHKELEEWNSVQQRIKTYSEVYLMDNVPNVNYGVRQKHQENQDIINRINNRIKTIEEIESRHTDIDWGRDPSLGELSRERMLLQRFMEYEK